MDVGTRLAAGRRWVRGGPRTPRPAHTQRATRRPQLVRVFLTIDTEFWPRKPYADAADYRTDFERDVYGLTASGEFGLRYQLDVLNAHGLRAVFFVEPLCAYAVGDGPVREMVAAIQEAGQDVQLHLHPEWLGRMPEPFLPGRRGQFLHGFSLAEQTLLVAKALAKIRSCGAGKVCAFRAGNYGANLDTLRALAANGIRYDTSHNSAARSEDCPLNTGRVLLQPMDLCGVREFPVTVVRAFGTQLRPLQLGSCSAGELQAALLAADQQGWGCVVIVSHSFELIHGRQTARQIPRPDGIAVRRFQSLCRFLEQYQDRFPTCTFADATPFAVWSDRHPSPLRAGIVPSSTRLFQQVWRRIMVGA